MKINYYGITNQGTKSIENEDSYALPELNDKYNLDGMDYAAKGYLFIVCDGMGGHKAGEIASELAANWIMRDYYQSGISFSYENIIRKNNHKLKVLADAYEQYKDMGTTLVSLLVKGKKAYIHNVGDSRCYLIDNNKMKQISEDHSEIWELYKKGIIEKDEIIKSPRKNVITQAIGLKEEFTLNSYEIDLPEKWTFFLCTDGVTDVLRDRDLEEIFQSSNGMEKFSEELIKAAREQKSQDDIAIIVVSNIMDV